MTLTSNIKEILKIKETFPNLQTKKIENIQKFINNDSKLKPKLNMTTKRLSRKQIIIPMSNENKSKFMKASSAHITNLNRALKNIKSKVMADFVYTDQAGVMIVTNKVESSLNLQTIEKCIKNSNYINTEKDKISCLSQSKLYLKIINIPYLLETTNTLILANVVKSIIKSNYIFNNIVIASRLYIIKVSPKSDMAII